MGVRMMQVTTFCRRLAVLGEWPLTLGAARDAMSLRLQRRVCGKQNFLWRRLEPYTCPQVPDLISVGCRVMCCRVSVLLVMF
ncbi:unnamed protein product [Cyberlindnera jadinii]|uniref:Uncharacterized protein n=1 Tax=Cyberlindnera jadinii (strain ATCC 18201 / CBS 1600 / BCRC 20928 / JCM 3617 / NBRC 0987 / NRRL Y-1542) TaxID=983966 RepID=A0A0H5C716_CYBJN|nr:unnamed protein product [Cyberlindnera jadinii]